MNNINLILPLKEINLSKFLKVDAPQQDDYMDYDYNDYSNNLCCNCKPCKPCKKCEPCKPCKSLY